MRETFILICMEGLHRLNTLFGSHLSGTPVGLWEYEFYILNKVPAAHNVSLMRVWIQRPSRLGGANEMLKDFLCNV